MAHYLLQLSYTPESWAAQLRNPENRIQAVTPVLEKLGGRFEQAYVSFGEYDIVAFVEAPDNVSAAAMSLAFSAGGAVKSIKMTPLLTVDEAIAAMRKAAEAAKVYRPAR
jgi:uncharacterized protein with GYD domain